jgi:hypothetical protein
MIFSVPTQLTLILKNISQCDVKHIMKFLKNTITSVLKTDIITSMRDRPIRLAGILVLMFVMTVGTAVILYLSSCQSNQVTSFIFYNQQLKFVFF